MTPPISPRLFAAFSRYTRWYVARGFHATRIAKSGPPPAVADGTPMVIYLNHASWWDPLIALVLANHFWPGRLHYAPMDQAALRKYRFLGRLGFFAVETDSPRGAAAFLRTSLAILENPRAALWITAQGGFRDPRTRPVELRPGLGHLARRAPAAAVIPLAIEYPFWTERFPEALCRFGPAVERNPAAKATAAEWTTSLEQSLLQVQESLATDAIAQEASHFETILKGSAGVGFFYDALRRIKAISRGQKFSAEHGDDRK